MSALNTGHVSTTESILMEHDRLSYPDCSHDIVNLSVQTPARTTNLRMISALRRRLRTIFGSKSDATRDQVEQILGEDILDFTLYKRALQA